jgi:uncharacterized protein YbbK (DUF523 family)
VNAPYAALQRALPDARSRRVVFLSHCLLNQNTRYLGGAVCPGVVACAVAPYLRDGTGIVQLPCPEQRVWGGVLKTRLLWLLTHRRVARLAALLAPAVLPYVRLRYAGLAKAAVDDIEDYRRAGHVVTGVVGVAGSPSCGAGTTLDMRTAAAALAQHPHSGVSAGWLNDAVIAPALCRGDGWFIDALNRELARRHLAVPVTEVALDGR